MSRRTPLAAALCAAWAAGALAQPVVGPRFAPPPAVAPVAPASAASAVPATAPASASAASAAPVATAVGRATDPDDLPLVVEADEIRGRPDLETVAEGKVVLQRGPVVLRADRLTFDQPDATVRAKGGVRLEAQGNLFAGSELQLQVQRFEGYLLDPEYFFARTQAGGNAERIDFIDRQRSRVTNATYTSCPRDGSGGPAWVLSAQRVKMDFEANEGIAEGAVLRFYGVPLLAAPVLSFPLTDERKSGWLPPTLNLDSRSGFELAVPYYWNIAPNRDATFTPFVLTRRGVGGEGEFRYLEDTDRGELRLSLLPRDRAVDRTRGAFHGIAEGDRFGLHYATHVQRVSDDLYWKDFPRFGPAITPRLLAQDLTVDRRSLFGADWSAYARVQHWQVLQDVDPTTRIASPYQRSPQVGLAGAGALPLGLAYDVQTEFNRFTLPDGEDRTRPTGQRAHVLGVLSRPWRAPGWWVEPKLTLNAASYAIQDTRGAAERNASRVIPTASVDAGLLFERDARWFGRDLQQTLEPRLLYVNTPFRDQSGIPLFDTAAKDFNDVSVFSENAFSGVDRVSDAHQLTAGVITRLIEPGSGAELLRLGVAQRVIFRDQRITPDGTPLTQRFSDLLLLGSSRLSPTWSADAAVQYQTDTNKVQRSVASVRWSPGPFRTLSAGYRQSRELSKQFDVGWQWPVYGPAPGAQPQAGACKGTLYSVGRTSYSIRDRRITDSLVGFEYDAGCWIGRIVAERLSTGRTEATTRLMLQLELVGLSRLGSNPLKVLKDNIPGYRLLREERDAKSTVPPVYE